MEDQETPKMLRACYQYALCEELCQNRGREEGKRICSKILQVCSIICIDKKKRNFFRCLIVLFLLMILTKKMLDPVY